MRSPIKPKDFGKDREIINEILVACLSHYGYPFDIAAGSRKELKEIDPLYMLQNAPSLVDVFTIAALEKKGNLSEEEHGWMSRFTKGLLHILIRSYKGDENAQIQLKAIDKLIFPDTYELPKTVIKDLAEKYYTRPALARGWRLRRLMGNLSWVVEPTKNTAENVLDGPIKLREKSEPKGHTIYDSIKRKDVSAYEVAKKHLTRGVTLKTLAIRVYLEELQNQGFEGIDERRLKRDLKEVENWEETLPKERRGWGVLIVTPGKPNVHLPTNEYSEGWKKRKRIKQVKNTSEK